MSSSKVRRVDFGDCGPPQPKKTRGQRTQQPLAPLLYPDFTQELIGWPHPDHARPSSLASDVIGGLPDRCESSPHARNIKDPAIRLAHEGAFA